MKNKSLIKTLFGALVLACSFQYFLILPTISIESTAIEKVELYANQFPSLNAEDIKQQYLQDYLDSISNEVVFSIPYVTDYTYQSLKRQQLQLGLDLKGGMRVTLGFDQVSFLKHLTNDPKDLLFAEVMERTGDITSALSRDFIPTFFGVYQQMENKEKIVQKFLDHPQLVEDLNIHSSVEDVETVVTQLSIDMVHQTKSLLEERINALGLAQNQINLDLSNHQINIEFPGVKNPERIRGHLLSGGALEFWETYRITDPGIKDAFIEANQLLARMGNN